MVEDRIDQAIEMATAGDPGEAIRLLWPDILDDEKRDEALFALAFCYEKSNNFATANYLYEELALRRPSFTVGIERQQECRKVMEERGLIEDFEDIGHRECLGCTLRYRAEYTLCPYCGTPKDAKKVYAERNSDTHEQKTEWKDPSVLETVGEMGREAADRIQDFVDSDVVQDISSKVVSASMATGRKAKELAQSRSADEVKGKTADIGKELMGKAEKLSESPKIRNIAQKIEDASWSASDKMKEMLTPESKQKVAQKARNLGDKLLKKVREVIDPPRKGE